MAEVKEIKKTTAPKTVKTAEQKPAVKKPVQADNSKTTVAKPVVKEVVKQEVKKAEPKVDKPKTAVKTEAKTAVKAKPEAAKAKVVKKAEKATAEQYIATGKRKMSIARVRMSAGKGKITINNRDIVDYFNLPTLISLAKQPLVLTNTDKKFDITANIFGGGFSGQAGALRHGITKALLASDEQLRAILKKAGLLTRDAKIKERKKYGLKKARKASQFSKR